MTTATVSSRYVLLAPAAAPRSATAEPKRRFRLARLQLNQTGPPVAGGAHMRAA